MAHRTFPGRHRSLCHAELTHHIFEFFLGHIDGSGCSQLARQFQTVFVDICDNYVAGTDMATNRGGHNAYGAGSGDQHIFTDEIKRQRCVYRIAKGVEDSGQIVADIIGDLEGVEGRDHQIFGEGAFAVNPNPHCVTAQMSTATTAITAVTTGDMTFA